MYSCGRRSKALIILVLSSSAALIGWQTETVDSCLSRQCSSERYHGIEIRG
jgi:hypothetical protein